MPSSAKTDLLCKEEVSFSPPVAVFIEINWQGHHTAVDGEDRKREKKGAGDRQRQGTTQKTTATTADFTIAAAQKKATPTIRAFTLALVGRIRIMLSQERIRNSDAIVICVCERVCVFLVKLNMAL